MATESESGSTETESVQPTTSGSDAPHTNLTIRFLHRHFVHGDLAGTSAILFQVFIELSVSGPQSPGKLADTLGCSRQSVHDTLNELRDAGFVERDADPTDARRSRYRVSHSVNRES